GTRPDQVRGKPAGPVRTVVTARTFHATFNEQNRMQTLHGAPNAKIISLTPGQPQRVSTSRVLDVAFAPDGQVSNLVQTGNVHTSRTSARVGRRTRPTTLATPTCCSPVRPG